MGLGIKTYLNYKFRRFTGRCGQDFGGGYNDWRAKRIRAILNHYSPDFFDGKTVLELGAGYGDIGALFATLGAQVTCLEGRRKNTRTTKRRYPAVTAITRDLEDGLPEETFDVIIHMGVLYHLSNPELSLRQSCRRCRHLILETEVCDSIDPDKIIFVKEAAYNPDQAVNGTGSRPSSAWVERILKEEGLTFSKITDARCNSGDHVYDWPATDSGAHKNGQRRMWFAEKLK